jgi:hypothetical protein
LLLRTLSTGDYLQSSFQYHRPAATDEPNVAIGGNYQIPRCTVYVVTTGKWVIKGSPKQDGI